MLHGVAPAKETVKLVLAPAQIVADPESVPIGNAFTVTIADPAVLPAHWAFVTAVVVYVLVAPGLTVKL